MISEITSIVFGFLLRLGFISVFIIGAIILLFESSDG